MRLFLTGRRYVAVITLAPDSVFAVVYKKRWLPLVYSPVHTDWWTADDFGTMFKYFHFGQCMSREEAAASVVSPFPGSETPRFKVHITKI